MCLQVEQNIFDLLGTDIILWHGDCLEKMKDIPDNSIDMVLTDPPYGTTACKWDSVIPFEPMWKELKRVTKDNGAICLFGGEPFSSNLRMSNIKMFKYDWIWRKHKASNFMLVKKQPRKMTENVSVFYEKQPLYIPQMKELTAGGKKRNNRAQHGQQKNNDSVYGDARNLGVVKTYKGVTQGYPENILKFNGVVNNQYKKEKVHPTQKPVELLEYLIRTYTLENEIILDFTSGSGSTGVAAKNLNRKCILIEKDDKYFEIGKERIEKHDLEHPL